MNFNNDLKKVRSFLNTLNTFEKAEVLTLDRQEIGIDKIFGLKPQEIIQKNFTGLSGIQTFQQALTFLDVCARISEENSKTNFNDENKNVLDFGCGWGRITQLLSLHFNPKNIHACDVSENALNLSILNNVNGIFEKINPWPPSGYKDDQFDYIFSYSVFSHLNEECAIEWINEFRRILKPRGIAFLTTRDLIFLDNLKVLHNLTNVPDYAQGAKQCFLDIEKTKGDYEKGLFCFDSKGSGGEDLKGFYGEALIPKQYVEKEYSKYFSTVGLHGAIPNEFLDQSTIWLVK